MPMYEYKCEDCGHQTTEQRRIAERNTLTSCTECDGVMLRQISRGTGFSLKGEGWYRDGYGKGGQ